MTAKNIAPANLRYHAELIILNILVWTAIGTVSGLGLGYVLAGGILP